MPGLVMNGKSCFMCEYYVLTVRLSGSLPFTIRKEFTPMFSVLSFVNYWDIYNHYLGSISSLAILISI